MTQQPRVMQRMIDHIRRIPREMRPVSAWTVFFLGTFVYVLFSWGQWRQFQSPSYDLTIFTQTLQQYAGFDAPIVTVKGVGYNILGDHFHPLLILLAPFYALAPSAFTLLILQALLLSASGFFITSAADHRLGRAAGWLVGLAYTFSWGVQEAHAVQFHEVAMGALVLAIAVWFLSTERWIAASITTGLLVFVKEDLPLTVVTLGVVIAWLSGRWVLGVTVSAWGGLWFLLIMKVLLPSLNHENGYDHSDKIDLAALAADPFAVIAEILTNDAKMGTIWLVLVASAFLVLRSPIGLAVIPTLAWRFVSTNEGYWGATWHYSLVLMPIMFGAVIDGAARLRGSASTFWRRCGDVAPAVVLAVAVTLAPNLPMSNLIGPPFWDSDPERTASARTAVELVGRGNVVESDVGLMNHLVAGNELYYVGSEENPVPDFIIIDQNRGGWNMEIRLADYAPQIHPDTEWRVIHDEAGIQVAQRV